MEAIDLDFRTLYKEFESSSPYQNIGKIIASHGMVYEATLPRAVIGGCHSAPGVDKRCV